MQCINHQLEVMTSGPAFIEVTDKIKRWLTSITAQNGQLTLFNRHSSASLTIQENADPDVQYDLLASLDQLAPRGASYRHNMEGDDDMPAHIKTMLTSVSLTIPVIEGQLTLGTWQGIYLIEHRDRPQQRKIALSFLGNC